MSAIYKKKHLFTRYFYILQKPILRVIKTVTDIFGTISAELGSYRA